MESLTFDDVELSYTREGGGEHVVLVHASPFVSWYRPLVGQLTGFSTLTYRRHLQRGEDGRYRPLTVAEDAAICVRLMDHVGWHRAHVVGHSYGALVALELARDCAERVGSVALLEPAARGVSSSAQVAAALQPVFAAYRSGDVAGAVDTFLRHTCGDGYRVPLEQVVPDALADAVSEADLFFQAEMAAVQQWRFGPADAERITRPVLNVHGARSEQRFVEASELIQSWFPQAERLLVPDAGHLLMVQNPTALAEGLVAFFARHPIGDEVPAGRASASYLPPAQDGDRVRGRNPRV
jgi:pimeloyl-ACP methyl ester carboxylesterase